MLDAPDLLRAGGQAGGIQGAWGRFAPVGVSPAWWKTAQANTWQLHRALIVAEIFAKE